jgi:hypothetical protein
MSSISLTDFKDPTKQVVWIKGVSYFCIAASLLSLFAGYLEYDFYQKELHDLWGSAEQASEAQDFQEKWVSTAALFQSAIIFQIIMFLMWVYRMNKNTRALAPEAKMKYTPAWSVGWFFIPIANLWKPYQVLKEIWLKNQKSSKDVCTDNPGFLIWFWIFYVISFSLGQALFRILFKTKDLSGLILENKLTLLSDFSDIPFYIFTIILVTKMHNLHMLKFAPQAQEYYTQVENTPVTEESKKRETRSKRLKRSAQVAIVLWIVVCIFALFITWLDIPLE